MEGRAIPFVCLPPSLLWLLPGGAKVNKLDGTYLLFTSRYASARLSGNPRYVSR